jgi:hypothetical protein
VRKGTNPAKITPKNIKKFITGWYRWFLFKLSRKKFLKGFEEFDFLPEHQQEQFKYRLSVIDSECAAAGACKICGCKIPQLQLADESCDGNCYPEMMSKIDWENYKKQNNVIV